MMRRFLLIFLLILPCFKGFGDETFCVHQNPTNSGMFAVFGSILGALNHYDLGGYVGIQIDLNSGYYLDSEVGPNWWDYFFEPIDLGNRDAEKHFVTFQEMLHFTLVGLHQLNRDRAFELIHKYVHLKPEIVEEVSAFIEQHFRDHIVIGVHHRGTDKVLEFPLIPYEVTFDAIKREIQQLQRHDRMKVVLYVATDEQFFLESLVKHFSFVSVVYNDFSRSSNGLSLHGTEGHYFYKNNYQKGKEALLDCLLLSNCHILIRPFSSSLSAVSTYFNPHMKLVNLY